MGRGPIQSGPGRLCGRTGATASSMATTSRGSPVLRQYDSSANAAGCRCQLLIRRPMLVLMLLLMYEMAAIQKTNARQKNRDKRPLDESIHLPCQGPRSKRRASGSVFCILGLDRRLSLVSCGGPR
ncbi:hypothetical protein ACSS6W_004122 [Trichoderma asperelloides]